MPLLLVQSVGNLSKSDLDTSTPPLPLCWVGLHYSSVCPSCCFQSVQQQHILTVAQWCLVRCSKFTLLTTHPKYQCQLSLCFEVSAVLLCLPSQHSTDNLWIFGFGGQRAELRLSGGTRKVLLHWKGNNVLWALTIKLSLLGRITDWLVVLWLSLRTE